MNPFILMVVILNLIVCIRGDNEDIKITWPNEMCSKYNTIQCGSHGRCYIEPDRARMKCQCEVGEKCYCGERCENEVSCNDECVPRKKK